jgi:hypothetical protein
MNPKMHHAYSFGVQRLLFCVFQIYTNIVYLYKFLYKYKQ